MLAVTKEDLEKLEDAMLGSDLRNIDELVWFLKQTKMIYVEENHNVAYMEILNERLDNAGKILIKVKPGCNLKVDKEILDDRYIVIEINKKDKRE